MMKVLLIICSFLIQSLTILPSEGSYWLEVEDTPTSYDHHFRKVTLKDFELLAKDIEYINHNSLLFDRKPSTDDLFFRSFERFQKLSRYASVELLKQMVGHEDPRVRTLGLYAIHSKGQPQLLPLIFSLIEDTESSFPKELMTSKIAFDLEGDSYEREKKVKVRVTSTTVGHHAGSIISFWMDTESYAYNSEGLNQHFVDDWKAFWELRKDCDHCAIWARTKFKRATTGTGPLPGERIHNVKNFKSSVIWKMPAPERQLTLLMLAAEWRSHPEIKPREEFRQLRVLASNYELREACQQLGPALLMKILRSEPITDDPDLQSDSKGYQHIVRWILMNAVDILPSKVAPELVQLGKVQEYPFHSPWWFIAAAQLDPDKAREYIDIAWSIFQGHYRKDERGLLMWANWKVFGFDAYNQIVKWIYNDKERSGGYGSGYSRFLGMLGGLDARVLLARLAMDERFVTLDAQDLYFYLGAISRNVLNPPDDRKHHIHLGKTGHPSIKDAQKAIRAWAQGVLDSETAG